jgi:hypothetical protein
MNWLKIAPAALGATCIVCSLAIPPALASNSPHQAQSAPEMGVSVVFSDVAPLPDNQELAQAQRVFKYISGLGANAVSLNIPFYMSSQSASTVSSGIGTPSAPVLRAIIEVARQDGLSVQLRPLLSELGDDTVTTGEWRGSIVPADPAEWFASYWTWLEPYVLVAKQTGVSSFSIGAELNTMVTATPSTATSPEAPTIGCPQLFDVLDSARAKCASHLGRQNRLFNVTFDHGLGAGNAVRLRRLHAHHAAEGCFDTHNGDAGGYRGRRFRSGNHPSI